MLRTIRGLPTVLAVVAACGQGSSPSPSVATNTNDWANERARQKYLEVAQQVCLTHTPAYLGLGIEVNTYYEHHRDDFARFVAAYKSMYDSLRATSGCAQTKFFVSFQLEKMKGLGTAVGYSGEEQWSILDAFDGKLDVLAFTTYPEVEFARPSDIPDDYYTSIASHLPSSLMDTKLAFLEMGWNSENLITVTGQGNSPYIEAKFIERFAVTTNSLKDGGRIELAAWSFMHDFRDTGVFNPFRTIGLRASDGGAKDVDDTPWNTWAAFRTMVGASYLVGVGPVPRGFPGSTEADWLDMYQQVPSLASAILAQTFWRDTPQSSGSVPGLFEAITVASTYHHAVLIFVINFFALDSGEPGLQLSD